ncbi:complement receptor type 2-like [Apostichopus japonicus]|uniref:complement receptor type 2-like n=1 Tax=Stichopus japonicus TaxID=307972 RepID=UPI003AB35616
MEFKFGSLVILIILNFQFHRNQCQSHENQCPTRDGFYALHYGCNHSCVSDSDCTQEERCTCDQKCGFICVHQPIDCSQPRHSSDGYVILPNPPIDNFGQTIRFGCQKGLLYGPETLHCLSDGNWNGPIPQCLKQDDNITCQDPPSMDHASWSRNVAKVTYTCNEGYSLEGDGEIVCSEDGSWSRIRGQCLLPTCDPPGRSENLIQIGLDYSVSATVYYECTAGYTLQGTSTRTCLGNRTWSGSNPSCLANNCPPLVPGTNLTIQRSGTGNYIVHDVVTFACVEGFFLKTPGPIHCTCQTDSQWSCGGVPNCTAIRCPLSQPTGRLRYFEEPDRDYLNYNQTVQYKCTDRSTTTLDGDAVRSCSHENRLSGTEPSCKFKCRELQPTPRDATRVNSSHHRHHGGYVIYVCKEGYRMIGTNRFVCQDGQWTEGDFPQCILDTSGQHDYQIRVSNNFTMINEKVIAYEGDRFLEMSCKVPTYKRPRWYFNLGSNHLSGTREPGNDWYKFSLQPLRRSMSGNYSCVVRGDSGKFVNISLEVRAWCQDLGQIRNGIRHPSDGNMLVGDFVNFECNEGYHISGTSTIGCRTNGTWSGPKPTCLIDNCEMHLPSVLHSVLIERTYETLENLTGVLTVSCNIGFERIGNEKMFCRDAIWTYTDNKQPACHRNSSVSIRDEITMRNLEHATVLVREGDEVDLSCTIDGSSSTTTFEKLGGGNNGTNLWIQNFTMEDVGQYACKTEAGNTVQILDVKILRRCSDISALENGYILHNADIADGIYHGDSVNFQCNDGYQLFGSHTCYCDRGQWLLETGQSICLPIITVTMVTDPRVHDNDVLTQYEGEEILLTCAVESKYSLEVLMTKYSFGWNFKGTVLANGTFYQEGKFEKGLRLRLPKMTKDYEGSYSCGTKLVQATVHVKMIKTCPDIAVLLNGNVAISKAIGRSSVATFSCNSRFQLGGSQTLNCLANGQWDVAIPTCRATACVPINITNGVCSGNSYNIGSVLTCSCNEGFSVAGSTAGIECLANGNWNGSSPVCIDLCSQTSCPFGQKCDVVSNTAVCICLEISDCADVSSLKEEDRVCGSNALTYPSSCHLGVGVCAQGGSSNLRLLHRGSCEICGRCRSKPLDSYTSMDLNIELDYGKVYFNGDNCAMTPFGYGLQMGTGFTAMSECQQICLRQNFCLVPHVEGPCDKSVPRWAYDVGSKVCVPFNYSGCGGNENNFVTRDQCTQTCPDRCPTCPQRVSLSELCRQNTTFILSIVTRVHSYATGVAKFRLTTTHIAKPFDQAPLNGNLNVDELSLNRNQDICYCPRLYILDTPFLISIDGTSEKISDPTFAKPWDFKLQTQFLATRSCFPYIGNLAFDDVPSLILHL